MSVFSFCHPECGFHPSPMHSESQTEGKGTKQPWESLRSGKSSCPRSQAHRLSLTLALRTVPSHDEVCNTISEMINSKMKRFEVLIHNRLIGLIALGLG